MTESERTDLFMLFDLTKIKNLKQLYEENIEFILSELPENNWNSPKKTKEFFKNRFGLDLANVTIGHINTHLSAAEPNSELEDVLIGLTQYLKLKYTLKNYINCILRHEEAGAVFMRRINGSLYMPNKQPIPHLDEIWDCAIEVSAEIMAIKANQQPSGATR